MSPDAVAVSRRNFVRSAGVTVGTLYVGGMSVDVVRGATKTGHPELISDSIQPTNTKIEVTVTEDIDGSTNSQTVELEGGEAVTALSELEGTEDSIDGYKLKIELSQSRQNDDATPRLVALSLRLPASVDEGRGVAEKLYVSLSLLSAAGTYDAVYSRRLPILSGIFAAVMWSVVAVSSFGVAAVDAGDVAITSSRTAAIVAAGLAFLSTAVAVLAALDRLPEMNSVSEGFGERDRQRGD